MDLIPYPIPIPARRQNNGNAEFLSMIKRSVIITAGGIGRRAGNVIPKQVLLIGNLPILAHTINEFYLFDNALEIVVTLPNDWVDYWKSLINSISLLETE
jgi:2-C-methyl-D-erythritol 4-phosphate cytidylyltransferase